MIERFTITNLDAIKALADPLRIHILTLFIQKPMTAKQMADHLGQPSAKIHYHVKELERNGLVKLVETREKGGILEKYYSAIAGFFDVHMTIGEQAATTDHRSPSMVANENR